MKLGITGRFATAAFAAAAFTAVGYAQDTAGTAAQRAGADGDRVVTVTGCVMAEKDVPGRDDNLFQRWGLMDRDYVLTHASAQHGTQQSGQSAQAGQTAAADRADHSQHAAGAPHRVHADYMLKLEGKDGDDLRQYANQRVEIRGKLDDHSWFERASRADRDRTGTTAAGPGATTGTGTAGTDRPATGTTATGTSGTTTTGTPTTGTTTGTAGAGDRLSSIDIESIRALGPCQQPQQRQ